MVKDVSLMVLTAGAGGEALLQILVCQDGVWRNATPLPSITLKGIHDLTDEALRTINGAMSRINNERPFVGWDYLETVGWGLYNSVVPREVQKVLGEAVKAANGDDVPTLHIHFFRELEWIPWEIMWDRQWEEPAFLGLRFQIARLPIVSTPSDQSDRQPHPVRRVHNILAENVLDLPHDHDNLFEAWRTTFCNLLPNAVKEWQFPKYNDGVGPSWPTLTAVEEAAGDDILHLTCHGGLRDQGEVYWTLNHLKDEPGGEYHINRAFVERLILTTTKPLVFGNACSSAAAGNQGGLSPGFGTSFFEGGASNFVGTLAPITKRLAIEFARRFYQQLLCAGLPVGKALHATKKAFFERNENDPSYLFYCLYGPAETRFQVVQ